MRTGYIIILIGNFLIFFPEDWYTYILFLPWQRISSPSAQLSKLSHISHGVPVVRQVHLKLESIYFSLDYLFFFSLFLKQPLATAQHTLIQKEKKLNLTRIFEKKKKKSGKKIQIKPMITPNYCQYTKTRKWSLYLKKKTDDHDILVSKLRKLSCFLYTEEYPTRITHQRVQKLTPSKLNNVFGIAKIIGFIFKYFPQHVWRR